jgi:hypothetical protein
MTPYRPSLAERADGGYEQSFTANVVHADDALVAFGDLVPDAVRGLPYGTPVHSLLVHLSAGRPEMIELNDQGNTVGAESVTRADLARDHVRIVFDRDAGPVAGRVSLSEEIELFEDVIPDPDDETFSEYDRFEDVPLTSLCVRFDLDDARFEALREKLATLLRGR